MTSIQFYHLTASPLERALPKLLEKAVAGGFRVSVITESETQTEALDQLLWTYDPGSFLPHACVKTGDAKNQPVWITSSIEAPNQANIICITSGALVNEFSAFERVVDMFDGRDESAVSAARTRWKSYKDNGHDITYFKQTDSGGWEKAASNG